MAGMFTTRILSREEIVLQVTGAMIGDAVGRFEAALNALQKSHYRRITLDLLQVSDVSSLFIGHILQAHAALSPTNRQVRICGYQDSVGDILRMLGVEKTVPVQKEPLPPAARG